MFKIMLNGQWTLRGKSEKGSSVKTAMMVPGDNFSALFSEGIISDPYYGKNEYETRWVGEVPWVISRAFQVTKELLSKRYIFLNLERVDTYADVYINDVLVGKTGNMFARYRFEVKEALQKGENKISVHFHRVDKIAKERSLRVPFMLPWSGMNGGSNNKIPHMNMVRKTHCHAGWDWGLTLMVSGIYEDIYLQSVEKFSFEYLTHKQHHHKDGSVTVEFTAHVHAYEAGEISLEFKFNNEVKSVTFESLEGEQTFSCSFVVDEPSLWWPVGFGKQALYTAVVSDHYGQEIVQKIGLREICVVNEKDDIGASFSVQVNGIDIFCKGANWIPSDAMPSRQTYEKHRRLLEDSVAANMNMIRIWGGGQYEYDHFYTLCDELGILVWQDLMFACSLYPSEDWFLKEVEQELAHQIRKLSYHASIALYCGDNEVIGALSWYEEVKDNFSRYVVNYDRLNRFLDKTVQLYDSTRRFWPSSPCNGTMDYDQSCWHDDSSGDMHFWDVWHSGASFEAYYTVRPRFCSEFGFQSFSSLGTIQTFTDESQMNITSPHMEHHQKNNRGNSIITEMFTRYFRMPNSFSSQIYLSQLQQSLAVCMGIEYWRTTRPVCMGALYWQLNDNWPVASWSSIEYTGRWKQLHYHVRRSYEPVIVTAHVKEGSLFIYGVNDSLEEASVQIKGGIYTLDGKLFKSIVCQEVVERGCSKELQVYKIDDLRDLGLKEDEHFCILFYEGQRADKPFQGVKEVFFSPYKSYDLPCSHIEFDVEEKQDGMFEIILRTDFPAFFVTLEILEDKGLFSDNSFTLIADQPKKVVFYARESLSLGVFRNNLRIYHLGGIN